MVAKVLAHLQERQFSLLRKAVLRHLLAARLPLRPHGCLPPRARELFEQGLGRGFCVVPAPARKLHEKERFVFSLFLNFFNFQIFNFLIFMMKPETKGARRGGRSD